MNFKFQFSFELLGTLVIHTFRAMQTAIKTMVLCWHVNIIVLICNIFTEISTEKYNGGGVKVL